MLASDYVIISRGKIVDALSNEELEAKCRQYVSIRMDNVPLGLTILERGLKQARYQVMADGSVRLYSHVHALEDIARLLQESDVLVTGLSVSEQTLEDYYLRVTGGDGRD